MATFTASFTAEAWVDDQAIPVDPLGPAVWDCTGYAQRHLPYLADTAQARDEDLGGPDGVLDNDDVFKADPAAPAWVTTWQGPFTIRIRRA